MLFLIVAAWVYDILTNLVQGRWHPNLARYFVLELIFLVAPFLGGCAAVRVIRLDRGINKLAGWLLLALFSMVFLYSCLTAWADYNNWI